MKLARIGQNGKETPAIVDNTGVYRDLSGIVKDIDRESLQDLSWANGININELPKLPNQSRIGPCVGNVGKIVCVGLNYSDHAKETGNKIPEQPVLFGKATSAISGPNDDIILPKGSTKTDWEIELAIVIGKNAGYVNEDNAMEHVVGYCIANDVSEREFQIEQGGQWIKGKSADTFAPIGPWLVTKEDIPNPCNLKMQLSVDSVLRQNGSTSTMIFRVPYVVSYISRFMSLQPGDIILTGTPPGVGLGFIPPIFLCAGQIINLEIEGLGKQCQKVITWEESQSRK